MRARVAKFWVDKIVPLRHKNEATVLIVTHNGIIKRFKEYLRSQNYQICNSVATGVVDLWNFKPPNGSIMEIVLPGSGPGKFVRIGDITHLCN